MMISSRYGLVRLPVLLEAAKRDVIDRYPFDELERTCPDAGFVMSSNDSGAMIDMRDSVSYISGVGVLKA